MRGFVRGVGREAGSTAPRGGARGQVLEAQIDHAAFNHSAYHRILTQLQVSHLSHLRLRGEKISVY